MGQPPLYQDEVSVHHPPADPTESALCCGCQGKLSKGGIFIGIGNTIRFQQGKPHDR